MGSGYYGVWKPSEWLEALMVNGEIARVKGGLEARQTRLVAG